MGSDPVEKASREWRGVCVAESAGDLDVQKRRVRCGERLRGFARSLEQRAVRPQLRELEVAQAGLPRAEELTLASQLQVDLRELEAVRRRDQRFEPLDGHLGQLVLRSRHEQAVALLRPAPDTATQLVQLGEP